MAPLAATPGVDELDLLLLEGVIRRPDSGYKLLADTLRVDQRTVAKRIGALTTKGILKQSVEIDWSRLGFQAQAFVGSTTARGIDYARRLNELISSDPRIIEAYETLGTYQYFMNVIESDTFSMRALILKDLDLLAADLTTTLVTRKVKNDQRSLVRYLRETRFPRSRDRGFTIGSES